MSIASTQLTTSGDTTVYTSSGQNAVVTIIVCNTGAATLTDETVNSCNITLNLVKFGSVSNLANTIVKELVVPAGETIFFSDEKIVLDNNDSIRATASQANLLSITVSTLSV